MLRQAGNALLFLMKLVLFLTVVGVFFIGQNIFYEQTVFHFKGSGVLLLLYGTILYFTCRIYNSFLFGRARVQEIILSWILCLFITNTIEYFQLGLRVFHLLPVGGFLAIFAVQVIFVIPLTYFINKLYFYLNPADKAIIIFGREKKARAYCKILQQHHRHFEIKNTLSQDEPQEKLLRHIDESESVFFLDVDERIREYLLSYCFRHNKRIYILPTFAGVLLNTAEVLWISHTPMFLPKSPQLDWGTRFIKRGMDILFSAAALLLLSWLMVIVGVVIRLFDRYPAIYKQTRVTRGGKIFTLYKFRSMRIDAEDDGIPRLASKNDDRVTTVGRFIRRTRIDELPQLFNVLLGSMSLVGPRPERPEIAKLYEEAYPDFSFRTKVKAGLTGFAQIYGKYNTEPEEKLFLDIMYIEQFSIWQDLKLILQTFKVIFRSSSTEEIAVDKMTALQE